MIARSRSATLRLRADLLDTIRPEVPPLDLFQAPSKNLLRILLQRSCLVVVGDNRARETARESD